MANITVKDANRVDRVVKTSEAGGVHTPHHITDQMEPGTGAADLGKAEDGTHATGDVGVMLLAVRKDAAASLASADGKYVPLIADGSGLVWARIGAALPAGTNNIGDVDLASAIPAGENFAGFVGRKRAEVNATPTVDTSAYADGDLIGGKLTFSNAARAAAGSGEIISLALSDLSNQDGIIDLILFDADPSATSFTDQAAFDVDDADLVKIIGVIPIAAADYVSFVDNGVASKGGLGLAFALASGTSLYGALVSRGTPTYAGASDLKVRLVIQQD